MNLNALLLLPIFLTLTSHCFAQHKTENKSLEQRIAQIDSAFQKDNIENFNHIVPLQSLQEFYASVATKEFRRVAGKSKIIRINKDSAFVLLSGLVLYGNSGDETNYSGNYTGIYKFELVASDWKLKTPINVDRSNQIKKHGLKVDILPGKGIKVSDTLTLDVHDFLGFATKLNHRARLTALSLNGSKIDFTFGGGLLWVNAKRKNNQKLIIDYTIEVEKDEKDANSGYFGDTFGHLRNQYFWHPFFSFSSPNDRADFSLHCSIPKAYYLSTGLPQKESVAGDSRIIVAKSELPTFGLSFYYDKEWEVNTFKKDQIDFVLYATKDFLPAKEVLYSEFAKNYDTLQKHFGKPLSNYFGIVQDRSNGNGWLNRSNNIVVAGEKGSTLIFDKPNPRATFGHEIAHGWTSPTGAATNFLMEGWATYAESLLLASVYGDTIISRFFASQKRNYIKGEFDGNSSLWDDYSNSGVSYSKGSWLFYMLEHQLGKKKLSTVMKNFIKSGDQSIRSFIHEISRVADKNMEPFLLSWLKSREIPSLNIQQSPNQLNIRQEGALFIFPIEIRLKLKDGTSLNKVLNMDSKEQTLKVTEGEIDSYIADPDHKLLFIVK
ncbi:M1 aminopeptidase family protein [Pedobacter caeni]|uniref:Peptidase M1 membrane alanine aminopeptidase domain-containing protein n=1 Tax=Pedobacter caeni TaxID=288992 RepID=A0A1M5A428_9SPHI|nr:hypothetical protein [Pedobacter caeni]SHF24686.1 hypothetical protein SAMN04488522_102567 [Pedobacter caeni]